MKNKKNAPLVLIIVFSGIIILLILLILGGFLYFKKELNGNRSDKEITHVSQSGELNPYQVVTKYFESMMGSIPGGEYNPKVAKKYTTSKLASQLENPSFAPTSFCIQDGPSDIRIDTGKINKKDATVKVSAKYGGEWKQLWEISLVLQKGEWKVAKIKCLGETGPTGDSNEKDSYEGQKIKDIPVYMGSTVKSFHDDGSSQSASYTASKGTTSAQILKNYEVNMPAWGWTKIAADGSRSRTFKHRDGRIAEIWIYYDNPKEGVDYVIESPPLGNSSLPAQ